jgi:hypothetical protein
MSGMALLPHDAPAVRQARLARAIWTRAQLVLSFDRQLRFRKWLHNDKTLANLREKHDVHRRHLVALVDQLKAELQ